ncbi:MAG: TetR/AcrR family transcriptional regulator, partial [Planctomycetota bacterium]
MTHEAEGSAPPATTFATSPTQRLPLDRVPMGSETDTPRRRPSLDRDRVLDATLVCLQEFGYDGTTIRRIARELGCAVGSIYRYFRDKRELLVALAEREFAGVEAAVTRNEPLDATIALYRRTADDCGSLYRLMFWLAGSEDSGPTLPRPVIRVLDGWTLALGDRDKAERVWAQLHGSIMLNKPLPGQQPAPGKRLPAINVGT